MNSAVPTSPAARRAAPPAGRRSELAAFTGIGVLCVLAGGLLVAATARAPSEHASWAGAYLVLVGGLAQAGLGIGQATFTAPRPSLAVLAAQLVGWNLGNAVVLVGTLLGVMPLVDLGGLLLVATLALVAHRLRSSKGSPGDLAHRLGRQGFRLLILILLVSIPVGLVLVRVRG